LFLFLTILFWNKDFIETFRTIVDA